MNIRDIVTKWLKANYYNGLVGEICGCGLGDLMCCDGSCDNCKPAYRCDKFHLANNESDCGAIGEADEGDEWHCTQNPATCECLIKKEVKE